MQNYGGGFLAALRFLTLFPLSWRADQDGYYFKYGLVWFPVIGLLIGCFTALICTGIDLLLPHGVTCLAGSFLLCFVSGFLHLDGVADTADGFFSSRPKERILQIMKDSRIGPMGVIILLFLLLGKYAALTSLSPALFLPALIIMPLSGRCAIIFQMALLPYARSDQPGLGDIFDSFGLKLKASASFLFLTGISIFLLNWSALILAVIFVVFNVGFARFCRKKIDGYTGDTLGACCELTELTTAICLSIKFLA